MTTTRLHFVGNRLESTTRPDAGLPGQTNLPRGLPWPR